MTTTDELDRLLDQFFAEGPSDISDAVIEAALLSIDTTNQVRTPWRSRRSLPMSGPLRLAVAAIVVAVGVAGFLLALRSGPGVGGVSSPSGTPGLTSPVPSAAAPSHSAVASTTPSASASVAPSPTPFAIATTFTSPRYRYSVTLPKDWMVVPAAGTWDGQIAPGFDDPTVDQWVAPSVQNRCEAAFVCAPTLWAFAGPTSLDLADWVAAQDAAAMRDHGCIPKESVKPITIDGAPATLERGACDPKSGPFLEIAYTVRNGIGYGFLLQDNVIEPRVETLDDGDLRALLATIRLAP